MVSYKTPSRGKRLKNHPPYEHYGKMGHLRRRRRNGDNIHVEGTIPQIKAVSDVLYVPDIGQNMLRIY